MEQRKHRRYRFLCEIWFPGKEESVAGTVSNLAVGGCEVGSPTPVDTGTMGRDPTVTATIPPCSLKRT